VEVGFLLHPTRLLFFHNHTASKNSQWFTKVALMDFS
jgi:hypothetical protein